MSDSSFSDVDMGNDDSDSSGYAPAATDSKKKKKAPAKKSATKQQNTNTTTPATKKKTPATKKKTPATSAKKKAPSTGGTKKKRVTKKKPVVRQPTDSALSAIVAESKSSSSTSRKRALKVKETEADEKANRIQDEALRTSTQKHKFLSFVEPNSGQSIGIPEDFVSCTNKEIKMKRSRAKKYLFAFPGQMSVACAGIAGTVHMLGTSTPYLDLEYSHLGKTLRLLGKVVYPQNTYALLSFDQKKGVSCEEPYNNIVVFDEYEWLSKENGKKTDRKIPMNNTEVDWEDPPQKGRTFKSICIKQKNGASGSEEEIDDIESDDSPQPAKSRKRKIVLVDDSSSSSGHDSDFGVTLASQRSRRSTSSAAKVNLKKMFDNEFGTASDGGEDGDNDNHEDENEDDDSGEEFEL